MPPPVSRRAPRTSGVASWPARSSCDRRSPAAHCSEVRSVESVGGVMRTLTRVLLASSGVATTSLLSVLAYGQADINPRLPNVLLLVDTSGSMEYLIPPDPSDNTGVKLQLP